MTAIIMGNAFAWLDATFCLRLTQALLHFFWQGCVIAVLFAAANLTLRRRSANARYIAGVVALAFMAVCLPVTFAVLPTSQPSTLPAVAGRASEVIGAAVGENQDEVLARATSPLTEVHQSNSPWQPNVYHLQAALGWAAPYASAIYLVGVAFMMLRVSLGLWGGRRLRQACSPITDPALLRLVRESAQRLGLKTMPAVACYRRMTVSNSPVPLVIGVLRPTVLLPLALISNLSVAQLEAVLLHELAHVRRFDLVVNVLQRIIEALLFFHPAVWWVSRRVSMERENACDDLVLAANCQPMQYADALVRVAELCASASGMKSNRSRIFVEQAALAATGDSSLDATHFNRRVLRLLGRREPSHVRLTTFGVMSLFAVPACFVVALALLRGFASAQPVPADPPPANRSREQNIQPDSSTPTSAEREAILDEIKKLGGNCEIHVTKDGGERLLFQGAVCGPKVDDAFVERLKQLDNLEYFWLQDTAVTDEGMKHIGQMKALTNLQISSKHVTNEGLKALAGLENLELLIINFPEVTDAGLAALQKLPKLRDLQIWNEKVSDEGFRQLLGSESVRSLGIYGQGITDSGLQQLEGNERLEHITLSSAHVTDKGLLSLGKAPALTGVSLYSPRITDDGLVTIGKMTQLQRLWLHEVPLTDIGLEHLKNLTQLQGLYLTQVGATGAGLIHLGGLKELAQLRLTGLQVDDAGFAYLNLFPKLTHLSLGAGFNDKHLSQITDRGLQAMRNATSVRYLSFDTTSVTDAGLMSLAALPELENVLFLRTPGLTRAGVEAFKKARPKVRFDAGEPDPRADNRE